MTQGSNALATHRLRRTALACAVLALAAAQPALAQDANPRDDRFTLRLSAFNPSADLRLGLEGDATSDGETAVFSDAVDFDTGDEWRPRGALNFRISDRQSIGASYYDYENDQDWSFGGGSVDPGPGGPVGLPAVDASGRIKFAMASAHYEYAVVATPAFEWGLGLGATHLDLEAMADVAWSATDELDAGNAGFREGFDGWSPALHTRVTWRPADRWRVDLDGQYLNANWGDFIEEDGHFERAGIVVEYLVTERFGVHVGYDWFRLKLRDTYAGTIVPPADAGLSDIEWSAAARTQFKVHGPMAGVTFRF
ncbi:hypothetical protein [Luteimonas sp. MC1750]|uniref:hypothetical protein n=1 Tax=Luteimonas sp. MC1750 TaxID=2799326 RepID=UPI0018F0AC1A|nr:hypothetical protein [Luteimonas sp. MC1750]MBJ6983308.1 hypothetical protein [Luteimonas sp. MC1750]QQO06169.1 hypothetical protein JGR68_01590 [Luteimonas sp. MC1750]